MTLFIGVRTVMFARNSFFARFAASAASWAARSSASATLFRVVLHDADDPDRWPSRSTRPWALIQCTDLSGQRIRQSRLSPDGIRRPGGRGQSSGTTHVEIARAP
jgi:hypothetical protein